MSGRGTSRRSPEDDTDSEGSARIHRRRPMRQGSSRDTSRQTSTAEGSSEDRPRRYRSPEPSTIPSPHPTSGVGQQKVAAESWRDQSADRSNLATSATRRGGGSGRGIAGSEAVNANNPRQNTRAATQGNRPASSAVPDDADKELQKGLEASKLERQKDVPALKDFDPNDLEEMIRKSNEEHEASVKREEEEAEKEFQEHLRYVKADGQAIKARDAQRATLQLRKAQEQEEANVQRMLKESLAAEAEREASAKAKLDALYASFGKSNNDVQSPRPQAVYASQRPPPTPAAPPSRASSSSAVGRTTPSSHAAQQPQRSPSARLNRMPAPSPMRQPATAYVALVSREPDDSCTALGIRRSASSHTTQATRQQVSPSRTPTARQRTSSYMTPPPRPLGRSHTTAASRQRAASRPLERSHTTASSRQPNPPTTRQPRRAPAASETIDEADEADQPLLAAIAASNQAQRGAAVPQAQHSPAVPAQGDEVNEDQFAATLQAALDESLGGAEEPDATIIGLRKPPPSYTEIFKDKIINHEKYTSAGGPDGSKATLNTTKEVRKIERMKKAQKAAEKLAEEKRRVAREGQFFREEAARGGNQAMTTATTTEAAPVQQPRPDVGVAGPSRSDSVGVAGPSRSGSSGGAAVGQEQAEMMRPRTRRRVQPRVPEHTPPGLGSVAPGRRAAAPWNDAFNSIAPRRGA